MHRYFKLALWIIVYLGVSSAIGFATHGDIQSWYVDLQKAPFNPPSMVFPIVWSFLYVLIATAGWRLWDCNAGKDLKALFVLYTALNWAWSFVFFTFHALALSFFWAVAISLVAAVLIIQAWRKRACLVSGLMLLPLFWTSFASVLSYYVWTLNR